MERYVLDTNCLLMAIPRRSPYHKILTALFAGKYALCVSTDILLEYEEVIAAHASPIVAENVIKAILQLPHMVQVTPAYRYHLIAADADDNKFVDCAITANAKCVVTNDVHFQVLKEVPFPKVDVVDIEVFMRIISNIE
mgnify:CR=1 FL=1